MARLFVAALLTLLAGIGPSWGTDRAGFIYEPDLIGPYPAVLFLPSQRGFTAQMQALAERLSEEGYVVLVPDIPYGAMGPEEVLEHLEAALGFIRSRGNVRPTRVALMGIGWGAELALWAGARLQGLWVVLAWQPRRLPEQWPRVPTALIVAGQAPEGLPPQVELHVLAEARGSFYDALSEDFSRWGTQSAWQRSLWFLKKNLVLSPK
jgi:dienelactone hydrolase